MDKLIQNQDFLRKNLITEIENYLGYAEDIHADKIFINEKTFDVVYRARYDDRRPDDSELYSVMDFLTHDGLWFKPDINAIEAAVQEQLPSPNIEAKFNEWCEIIKSFLIEERPTSLHSCRLYIGCESVTLDCGDEAKESVSETTIDEIDSEDFLTAESVDVIPIRKAVTKTATGYSISGFQLTKLILNYIKPENS